VGEMKKGKNEDNPKNTPVQASPAKPDKKNVKDKKKVKAPKAEQIELPLMVEVAFSFSWIFLILVDCVVVWVSFSAGATWTDIFVRVVVSTVIIGIVLWLLSMNLSNGSLAAALKTIEEEEEEEKKKAAEASTDMAVEA
jgi:hypothetical protein